TVFQPVEHELTRATWLYLWSAFNLRHAAGPRYFLGGRWHEDRRHGRRNTGNLQRVEKNERHRRQPGGIEDGQGQLFTVPDWKIPKYWATRVDVRCSACLRAARRLF